MGAGLGGGSSDAAAVLLALPVLVGEPVPMVRLNQIAAQLGSDVPFFLYGGTAVGLGRGDELYPLPDQPARYGVLVAPNVAVSTVSAYKALSARLNPAQASMKMASFQNAVWRESVDQVQNDFEAVVFALHPKLKLIKSQLMRAGSTCASMTGSGSAIFGLFASRVEARLACQTLARKFKGEHRVFSIRLMDRGSYRRLWRRQLQHHLTPDNQTWPPQS
jgi:4-diphosphocytidyl-2-C-methyl-D-erythritol kinase